MRQRPARPQLRLLRSGLIVGATLCLVAPGAANATTSISPGPETIAITTNYTGGVAGLLTIEPNGAGAADDVLRVLATGDVSVNGCTAGPNPQTRLCTIGSADKVSWTFASGPFTDNTLTVDLDRPGFPMQGTFAAGNSQLTFDGTATTSSSRLLVSGAKSAKGGAGDDALTGTGALSPGDLLEGGPGDDAISGLRGWDVMRGGPGDDAISPGDGGSGTGAETAEAGEGTQDTISFADQDTGHAISFDGVANDGAPGHPVVISGFEAATGGSGNDTIIGDAGFNHLYGLGGDDVVDGAGGGHDVLRGGGGGDTIRARDASPLFGDVACGGDSDTAIVDAADIVAPDCETVDRAPAPSGFTPAGAPDLTAPSLLIGGPARISRSALLKGAAFSVTLSESATLGVELLVTAKRVASAAAVTGELVVATASPGAVGGRVTVRLRPRRALLAKARSVTLRATAVDAAGNRAVVSRRVSVTDPRPRPKPKPRKRKPPRR